MTQHLNNTLIVTFWAMFFTITILILASALYIALLTDILDNLNDDYAEFLKTQNPRFLQKFKWVYENDFKNSSDNFIPSAHNKQSIVLLLISTICIAFGYYIMSSPQTITISKNNQTVKVIKNVSFVEIDSKNNRKVNYTVGINNQKEYTSPKDTTIVITNQ